MLTSPSCACCGGECFPYTDSFSDGVIAPWTQESGTWTEFTGLGGHVDTSDSNAQLIYGDPVEPFTDKFLEVAHLYVGTTGTKQRKRVIFSWVDSNNFWFIEGTMGPSGGGGVSHPYTLSIGKKVAGSESILTTYSGTYFNAFLTGTDLRVCYRDGWVRGFITVEGDPEDIVASVQYSFSLSAGDFGIGTGDQTGFGTEVFAYWSLTIDTASGYNTDCLVCPDLGIATGAHLGASATISAFGTFTQPSYTASASLRAASTLSASGTFAEDTFTATANLRSAATFTATATFTQPTYTATASLRAAATLSGSGTSGTPTYTATASLRSAAVLSGSATFTKPTYTATASLRAAAILTATGTFTKPTYTATASLPAAAILTATGTFSGCGVACCDRNLPGDGGDEMPTNFSSEIVDYTCDCLDNEADSGPDTGEICLTGIDGKPFVFEGGGIGEWRMVGDISCLINNFESCELSRAAFMLRCGGAADADPCTDWILELTNEGTGCVQAFAQPQPGATCDPVDMTFVLQVDGCNCSPPGVPGSEEGGVCDCQITIRIWEP